MSTRRPYIVGLGEQSNESIAESLDRRATAPHFHLSEAARHAVEARLARVLDDAAPADRDRLMAALCESSE
jgi:hypothetical protein